MHVVNFHKTFEYIAKAFANRYPEEDNKILLVGIDFIKQEHIEQFKKEGKEVIVLQSEQMFTNSPWVNMKIFRIMELADKILEYDSQNLMFYYKHFGHKTELFDLWYDKDLEWENNIVEKDIDVLFFGTMNERRYKIMANINDNLPGVKIQVATNTWGKDLEQIINRSKIILNIHYYDYSFVQEQIRLFPLLINDKCVLSETSAINHFGKSIIECLGKDMPGFIDKLLKNDLYAEMGSALKFECLSDSRLMEHYLKTQGVDLN